jgi:hypothetical protein
MTTLRRFLTKETVTRLSFELLVVFIGVSAAFVVDNYREKQDRRHETEQIYSVLASSLEDFHRYGDTVYGRMQAEIARWEQRDSSEYVRPPLYREPGGEGPPVGAWEAMLASGGIEIIDAQLFWQLTLFFNRVQSLRDRYQRYNAITEQQIFPLLYYGNQGVYQAGTRKLLPQVGSHIDLMRVYIVEHKALLDWSRTLEQDIRERLEE